MSSSDLFLWRCSGRASTYVVPSFLLEDLTFVSEVNLAGAIGTDGGDSDFSLRPRGDKEFSADCGDIDEAARSCGRLYPVITCCILTTSFFIPFGFFSPSSPLVAPSDAAYADDASLGFRWLDSMVSRAASRAAASSPPAFFSSLPFLLCLVL
ncbi:hypothetical protein AA313_de0204672 [Arthrobotrys entomopaga]|nr:hypothetical protein AA313_de0204672 [Arthrobotrys entomopaga]